MTTAAFALTILCASTALPKEPGPPERSHPGAQPAKPVPPAHAKDDEKPGKPNRAEPARGNSAEAKEAAPGQAIRDENAADKAGAKDRADKPGNGDEKQRERSQTRDLRKKAHRDRLMQRHGAELLQRPPILAELKTHAWRMARLERLRTLAENLDDAAKRAKTIERIDKLIDRETKRHERQLEQLKSGAQPNPEKHADKAGGVK